MPPFLTSFVSILYIASNTLSTKTCPVCSETELKRDGYTSGGKRRWQHPDPTPRHNRRSPYDTNPTPEKAGPNEPPNQTNTKSLPTHQHIKRHTKWPITPVFALSILFLTSSISRLLVFAIKLLSALMATGCDS